MASDAASQVTVGALGYVLLVPSKRTRPQRRKLDRELTPSDIVRSLTRPSLRSMNPLFNACKSNPCPPNPVTKSVIGPYSVTSPTMSRPCLPAVCDTNPPPVDHSPDAKCFCRSQPCSYRWFPAKGMFCQAEVFPSQLRQG